MSESFVWRELSETERDRALSRPEMSSCIEIVESCNRIVLDVKENGDAALHEYCEKFDGYVVDNLRVSRSEIENAKNQISSDLKKALIEAKKNIETFHAKQLRENIDVEVSKGIRCKRKVFPISKVGLYVPGGTAPLVSSVLMQAIPAKLAGCETVYICTPADPTGKVQDAILYAASICGVDEIYRVGGAQAIAAMAFGTETLPKVAKIFGPGNQYVTEAKKIVAQSDSVVSIDMPAGPSEVMVVVDETSNPKFAAMDLLSQAEHGSDSQVVLVSQHLEMANKIKKIVFEEAEKLSRREIILKSLSSFRVFITSGDDETVNVINRYAPEHLILMNESAKSMADRVYQAGSVFIGTWTPESLGDYASGTNHVLPTNGYAKQYSGLSVESFQKTITFQESSREGLQCLSESVMTLAAFEGLSAHRLAVQVRLEERGI